MHFKKLPLHPPPACSCVNQKGNHARRDNMMQRSNDASAYPHDWLEGEEAEQSSPITIVENAVLTTRSVTS